MLLYSESKYLGNVSSVNPEKLFSRSQAGFDEKINLGVGKHYTSNRLINLIFSLPFLIKVRFDCSINYSNTLEWRSNHLCFFFNLFLLLWLIWVPKFEVRKQGIPLSILTSVNSCQANSKLFVQVTLTYLFKSVEKYCFLYFKNPFYFMIHFFKF